jgi:hypothetical protein
VAKTPAYLGTFEPVLRDFGIFVLGVAVGLVAAQCIATIKTDDESSARDLASDIEGRLESLELEMS